MIRAMHLTARLALPLLTVFTACEGVPGSSKLEVLSPHDGSVQWSRTIPAERFELLEPEDPRELYVIGYDSCSNAGFRRAYDRETGKPARSAPAAGPVA